MHLLVMIYFICIPFAVYMGCAIGIGLTTMGVSASYFIKWSDMREYVTMKMILISLLVAVIPVLGVTLVLAGVITEISMFITEHRVVQRFLAFKPFKKK
jgi:hypothetical protein